MGKFGAELLGNPTSILSRVRELNAELFDSFLEAH